MIKTFILTSGSGSKDRICCFNFPHGLLNLQIFRLNSEVLSIYSVIPLTSILIISTTKQQLFRNSYCVAEWWRRWTYNVQTVERYGFESPWRPKFWNYLVYYADHDCKLPSTFAFWPTAHAQDMFVCLHTIMFSIVVKTQMARRHVHFVQCTRVTA